MELKTYCIEQTEDRTQDNVFHNQMNEDVTLVSVPITENKLSNNPDEKYPPILDTLKSKLEFKGSIRLSESGKSWNLFRDALENKASDFVSININMPDTAATPF
tara:strand:+ start:422 stop:733 length:312 start_codon:yes stop_codon:yes gene_type:complete